jgi:hypothetical protein
VVSLPDEILQRVQPDLGEREVGADPQVGAVDAREALAAVHLQDRVADLGEIRDSQGVAPDTVRPERFELGQGAGGGGDAGLGGDGRADRVVCFNPLPGAGRAVPADHVHLRVGQQASRMQHRLALELVQAASVQRDPRHRDPGVMHREVVEQVRRHRAGERLDHRVRGRRDHADPPGGDH